MSKQQTVRRLPNGDIWEPRYEESEESANMRFEQPPEQRKKTQDEKVAEAMRVEGGQVICPWCGQTRESADSMKEHILARHGKHVQGDDMAELTEDEQAAYAASRRRLEREQAADEAAES